MQTSMDPEVLNRWVGRSETAQDTIRIQPSRFMELTLDRAPALSEGDPLPPLWHWLYFLNAAPLSGIGRDGHPALGEFLPPVALPRRMWAGGRLGFMADLAIGSAASKTSTITDVTPKRGRSGALCFVTVRHEILSDGRAVLWEEHDIVYREDPHPDAVTPSAPAAPTGWPHVETVTPSEVLLFRYSALTFNGHRIHYDRDYATSVEGHDGLIFHGPLTATLLADLAVRRNPGRRLTGFSYRAVSALYDTAPFTIAGNPDGADYALVAANPDGRIAMQGTATFVS